MRVTGAGRCCGTLRSDENLNLRVSPTEGWDSCCGIYTPAPSCHSLKAGHCTFLGAADWAQSKWVLAAPESPQAKTYRSWCLSQAGVHWMRRLKGVRAGRRLPSAVVPKSDITDRLAGQPLSGILKLFNSGCHIGEGSWEPKCFLEERPLIVSSFGLRSMTSVNGTEELHSGLSSTGYTLDVSSLPMDGHLQHNTSKWAFHPPTKTRTWCLKKFCRNRENMTFTSH